MNRRGFMGSILALGAAPAIVRADSLMRIVPMDTTVHVLSGFDYAVQRALAERELMLMIDTFAERYIEPAMAVINRQMERDVVYRLGTEWGRA